MNTSAALLRTLTMGAALLLASGCTDHDQLKQELMQAASKQEEIKTYRFSGHAELALHPSLFEGLPPLTTAMLSLFKEASIEYKGVTSLEEPVRVEADITIKPKDAEEPIKLPLLLQDNKLYIHLPALNAPDEYLMFSLQQPERLKDTGHLSALMNRRLLEGLNAGWIDEEGPPANTGGKRMDIRITDNNREDVEAYVTGIVPALLDELVKNGLGSPAQTDQWKKSAGLLNLKAPGSIALDIDAQGFLEGQEGRLFFTTDTHPDNQHALAWTYHTTDINQPAAFTRNVPDKVKSASDLLQGQPAVR
ncbi:MULTISPECIES: hypothetical protein [Paenibacillus]|uniref:hypothetical protein n=1 Tax=Paenibacillus TaxID=44249 RepID=UPI0022B8C9E3|nr:hypothetical protein [Paenibacillus caseinilyticus]MCZ8518752.1 hypothetical protein [Paenibacillus caseinilyticus]